jgi:hypothetical protein
LTTIQPSFAKSDQFAAPHSVFSMADFFVGPVASDIHPPTTRGEYTAHMTRGGLIFPVMPYKPSDA